MALVKTESGCKVGWSTYDVESEAREAAKQAHSRAVSMLQQGYDFGYQSPGEVTSFEQEGVTRWRVTTP